MFKKVNAPFNIVQDRINNAVNDLNELKTPGIYHFNGANLANLPSDGIINGWVLVLRAGTEDVWKQVIFRYGSAGTTHTIYDRLYAGGTWYPWAKYAGDLVGETNPNHVYSLPKFNSLSEFQSYIDTLAVGDYSFVGQGTEAMGKIGLPATGNRLFKINKYNASTVYIQSFNYNFNHPECRIKKYNGTWNSDWSQFGTPVDMSTRTSLITFGSYKTAGEVITLNQSKNDFIYLLAYIGDSTNGITVIPILGNGWGTTSDKFALTSDNESLTISFPSATSMKIEAVNRASSGLRQLYGVGLKII